MPQYQTLQSTEMSPDANQCLEPAVQSDPFLEAQDVGGGGNGFAQMMMSMAPDDTGGQRTESGDGQQSTGALDTGAASGTRAEERPGSLTGRKEQSAVRYNNRRYRTGHDDPDKWWTTEEEIRDLQTRIGASPTGVLDGQTAQKVTFTQEREGLKVDGKIGPMTEGAVDFKPERPSGQRAGGGGGGGAGQARDERQGGGRPEGRQAEGDENAEPSAGNDAQHVPSSARSALNMGPVPDSGDAAQLPAPVGDAAAEMGAASPELKKAYRDLKAWTIRKMYKPDKRARGVLAKYPNISEQKFFKKYWAYKCYQFANALLSRVGGKGKHSVFGMQKAAKNAAKGLGNGQTPSVAGRSTKHRGMTAADLGGAADLKPGTAVHVKVQYEVEKPYHKPDDFHHWFVYIGGGTFSDSHGAMQSGAKMDTFLKGWVKRGFGKSGKFDYKHLYNERYATAKSLQRGRPRPLPGLQPRVTAVYNPEDSKAGITE